MAADKTANKAASPPIVKLEILAEFTLEKGESVAYLLDIIQSAVDELRGYGEIKKAEIAMPAHNVDMS